MLSTHKRVLSCVFISRQIFILKGAFTGRFYARRCGDPCEEIGFNPGLEL